MKNRQIRVNERILLITKSEIRIFDYIRCIARENVKKRKKINQIELIRLYIAIFKKNNSSNPPKKSSLERKSYHLSRPIVRVSALMLM